MKKYVLTLFLILVKLGYSENYAILISGDRGPPVEVDRTYMASANTRDEFWNDLYLMWESLYTMGFKNDNIYVFYEEGEGVNSPARYNSSSEYDIDDIVDYETKRDTIFSILEKLADGYAPDGIPQLTNNDFLFIWTFGHGNATSTDTTITVWDNTITDTELASYLDDIAYDNRIIWMQQCFSGGFIDDLSNSNSVIITACKSDEFAYRADEDYPDGADSTESDYWGSSWSHHGEFNYHGINAANLETIIGNSLNAPDKNSDNKTSIQEIFDWADSTESSKNAHYVYPFTYGPQHPQIEDVGSNASSLYLDVNPPSVTISSSVESGHPKIS
jgi:hypothetical protein